MPPREMPCGTQPACLHVEAEIDHVAVLDHIVLALGPQQTLFLGGGHAAAGHHLVEVDGLRPDEAPLDVGVNLSGGLGGLGALADGPGPALVLAVGQEGDQAQQLIAALDQPVQAGLLHPQVLQEHGPLVGVVQLGNVLLQLGADGQHLGPFLLGQVPDHPEVAVVLVVGEARLVHVGGVDDGLQAQQVGGFHNGAVLVAAVEGAGGPSGVEMLRQGPEYLGLVQELLVALGGLGGLLHPAVHHVQVRHDQLQVDGLDVAQGVHRHVGPGVGHHVHDVLVVEAAHHMDDGVGAADVLQELVAQACPLAGALHQARNVHKFDDGGGLFVGLIHLRQLIKPCIRHGHHAHVGLDGAEGVVGAFGSGVGDGVEQR